MGLRSSPLKCPVSARRLKVHGGWQIWLRLGLLGLGLLSSGGRPVAAISTTDAQVEATHTTLPVTLRLDDALSSAPPYVDLSEAETKDPQRLEIIKQIRKVNHDGSYTVGYEAEDGTFKIESRDVLGNVKGTYGYIDANGDIKRVSYGGDAGRPLAAQQPLRPAAVTPVPDQEEDIVHIPVRANRSQHLHQQHQLLVPTTRRPSNYQPPTQQQHHLQQYTLQHGSTLRPSVIQTIPRKRPNYSTPSTTNSTAAVTTVAAAATSPMVAAPSTTEMPQTSPARGATTTTTTRVTTAAAAVGEVSEQSTASSTHTASTLLHTKPGGGGLLIIRPTPLPYQAAKPAEQLARPELRLESPPKFGHSTHPSKKTVRGNFFRRQLTSPAAVTGGESGEQYEAQAQQQQQITYADGGELYGGGGVGARSLYTTHPTTRIPAAVLAARQRAAHLQSVLQAQGERLPTTERVYVRQPPRAQPPTEPPSAAANRHAYEPSTESTSENSYVTDSPVHGQSVVQIPGAAHAAAAAASEAEPEAEERHPILFRPRPIDYRPPGLRYRTPYGLPSTPPQPPAPFARAELPYGRATGQEPPTDNDIGGRENGQPPYLAAYRQQRRLLLPAAEPDGYSQQQQQQQQQQQHHQQPPSQQQQQSSYPIPVPYGGGRLAPSPYYYDIPAERPLTARDFERILQVLIYRHQQLQQQQAAALRYGGYHPGGFGGRGYNPHNPYFLEPSVAPYGLPGGGYPQQQIPRPPLPFPYGGHLGQYDGYQNLLYSPSAGAGVRSDGSPDASGYGGRDGLGSAIRRQGQGYYPSQEPLGGRGGGGADYLPPEVRESLLYRMLMLAMQAPGSSGEVLPLAAAAAASLTGGGGYPLQGAPSMTTVRAQTPPPRGELGGSATTMSSLYSKKPVRSVQILGEE